MENDNCAAQDERQQSYDTLELFPEEILIFIFAHLDLGSLRTCGTVCSRWNQMLKDDVLWKQLFERDWSNSKIAASELIGSSEDKWKRIYLSRNELGGQWEIIHNTNFFVSNNGLEITFLEDSSFIDWDEVKYVKTAKPWENGEYMLQFEVTNLRFSNFLARGVGLGVIIHNRQSAPNNNKPRAPESITYRTMTNPPGTAKYYPAANPNIDYVYWSNGKVTHFNDRVYVNEKSFGNKDYPGVYVDMKKGLINFIKNSNRIKTILDPKLKEPGCQVYPVFVVDKETAACVVKISVGPFKKQAKLRANIRRMVQRRNSLFAEQHKPPINNTKSNSM